MRICSISDCGNKHKALGYCIFHYARFKAGIALTVPKYEPKSGENSSNWKGGVSEYPYSYLMQKNRLIKLAEHKICECCRERLATQVHHIDEGKTNHSLSNLMAVCCKCNLTTLCTKNTMSKYQIKYGMPATELARKYHLPIGTLYGRMLKGIPLNRKRYAKAGDSNV